MSPVPRDKRRSWLFDRFDLPSIKYYGMIFRKTGVSPDPNKVHVLKELPPPSNVTKLRSFLGMTNYLSRVIKYFAIISEPLRRLTKKDVDWLWSSEQDAAFTALRDLLIEDTCAAYFDVNGPASTLTSTYKEIRSSQSSQ